MIKVKKTSLEGFLIVELETFKDDRGFFLETFQEKSYKEVGITDKFVQDNQSRSSKGVLRGMHFQVKRPQAQIVTVMRGCIFDVGVDLRQNSSTFGQWYGVELSDVGQRQVYMAPGIAHGFCVLSDLADLHYKVSRFYDSDDECGMVWNDSEVNIDWPLITPLIHQRDATYQSLSQLIDSHQLPYNLPIEVE
jgi:dTDP-4-dehydrorhamnose 3,5-epimerase